MDTDKGVKIAATVLHVAGATFSEIGNALKLHQSYVYGSSTQRQSPITFNGDAPSPRSPSGVPEFHGDASSHRSASGVPEFHGGRSARAVSEHRQYPGGDRSYRSPSEDSKYAQTVPYLENMGGLHPNKMILITGVPLQNASRFSVYLQRGDSPDPQQIAMVFDVRFQWGSPVSQNCVVLNHKEGHWDEKLEERNTPCFPFKRGKEFEIIILVEDRCFKIAVNDKHFTEFNHRVDPGRMDTLRIEGDVKVTAVQFQE